MKSDSGIYVESIQVGVETPFAAASDMGATGIFKEPVDSAVVDGNGLVEDTVVNTKHHGGPDQAVYVYSREDYDFWERELGQRFPPGQFGENLTLSSASEDGSVVRVGDRYTIGDVTLEVTAGRIPCNIFEAKMGIEGWVQTFRDARRPGFYCRVVSGGTLRAGDGVARAHAPESNITMLDAFDLYYDRKAPLERIEQALASPVAIRQREDLERRIARLG